MEAELDVPLYDFAGLFICNSTCSRYVESIASAPNVFSMNKSIEVHVLLSGMTLAGLTAFYSLSEDKMIDHVLQFSRKTEK